METSLTGRRALVCGASQGIGRACAERWPPQVHPSPCWPVRPTSSNPFGPDCPAEITIVSRPICPTGARPATRVAAHIGEVGPVNILVHNSGGPKAGPAHQATPDDFLAGLTPHVLGGQSLVQAVLPGMRESGYGRIINIVSTSVVTPIKGLGVSNVVRGAINNWMRTLAYELGPDGITVNNILPGYVGTDRLSSLMEGRAERDGCSRRKWRRPGRHRFPWADSPNRTNLEACAFLASPAAAYISGVNLPVDGGRLASM